MSTHPAFVQPGYLSPRLGIVYRVNECPAMFSVHFCGWTRVLSVAMSRAGRWRSKQRGEDRTLHERRVKSRELSLAPIVGVVEISGQGAVDSSRCDGNCC